MSAINQEKKSNDDYSAILQAVGERTAARLMEKSVQSLRNDRHLGRGVPYLKLGRSVRYLLSDIQAYILKHRIDPEEKDAA